MKLIVIGLIISFSLISCANPKPKGSRSAVLMEHLRTCEKVFVEYDHESITITPYQPIGEESMTVYMTFPQRKNDPVIQYPGGIYWPGVMLVHQQDTFLATNWSLDYVD